MPSAVESYKAMKTAVGECTAWASLLGKRYDGGGGGTGQLRSMSVSTGQHAPTIYYQHSNGSQNYHAMPSSLTPFLEQAIKESFEELLARALQKQADMTAAFAAEAANEYRELMIAAELEPKP